MIGTSTAGHLAALTLSCLFPKLPPALAAGPGGEGGVGESVLSGEIAKVASKRACKAKHKQVARNKIKKTKTEERVEGEI